MDLRLEVVYQTPSSTDEVGDRWTQCLGGIGFYDATVGWAVGSGQILRTMDGGRTWVNLFERNFDARLFSPAKVIATDPETCWVIGDPFHDIKCIYTRDGGDSWQALEFEAGLCPTSLFFTDPNHGWIAATSEGDPGAGNTLYVTEDTGVIWKSHRLALKGRPERVRFVNANVGWLLETLRSTASSPVLVSTSPDDPEDRHPLAWPDATQLRRTEDGGRSWHLISSFPGRIMDLYVLDVDSLFALGEDGFIARTRDRGGTWEQCEPVTEHAINAMALADGGIGIACGDCNLLMVTRDGGRHWEAVTSVPPFGGGVYLSFFAPTRGVLGSTYGVYLFELRP